MTKFLVAPLVVLGIVLGVAAPAQAIRAQEPTAPGTGSPGDPASLRKICTDAMNADVTFAPSILETAYQVQSARCEGIDAVAAKRRLALDQAQHETAAAAVSKNERHVVMAYIAMWLLAVGFVIFLWRRQQLLKGEIESLRRDLEAAAKVGA